METLGKLFGGTGRVKIMRLFLLNPEKGFDTGDVAARARITGTQARRELSALEKIGFIKRRMFMKSEIFKRKHGKKTVELSRTKRVSGWFFNQNFEYRNALKDVLIDAEFITNADLARRFKPAGKIKLLLVAGIFTRDPDSRLDLLLVGDNLRRNQLEKAIKILESEIGKELEYAIFDSEEFFYRSNMYDKLVRDSLDYPHDVVIDLGMLEQVPKIQ